MRVNKCNVSNSSCIVAREVDYIDWMGKWKNLAYNQPPIHVGLFTLAPSYTTLRKNVSCLGNLDVRWIVYYLKISLSQTFPNLPRKQRMAQNKRLLSGFSNDITSTFYILRKLFVKTSAQRFEWDSLWQDQDTMILKPFREDDVM